MDGLRKERVKVLEFSCLVILKYGQTCLGDGEVGDKKGLSIVSVSFILPFRKRGLALIQGTTGACGRLMASGLVVQKK